MAATNVSAGITPSADLSLTQRAYPAIAMRSGVITYELTVSNAGPSAAVDAVLADFPPRELRNVVWAAEGCRWRPWKGAIRLGNMVAGATRTVRIRGMVRRCAKGCISNCAEVFSLTADPSYANNRVEAKLPLKAE